MYAYTFTGFAVLVVILPLNGFVLKNMQAARAGMVAKTDIRTRMLNEVLQAIKVVRVSCCHVLLLLWSISRLFVLCMGVRFL